MKQYLQYCHFRGYKYEMKTLLAIQDEFNDFMNTIFLERDEYSIYHTLYNLHYLHMSN